jgi:hypothetical protein
MGAARNMVLLDPTELEKARAKAHAFAKVAYSGDLYGAVEKAQKLGNYSASMIAKAPLGLAEWEAIACDVVRDLQAVGWTEARYSFSKSFVCTVYWGPRAPKFFWWDLLCWFPVYGVTK